MDMNDSDPDNKPSDKLRDILKTALDDPKTPQTQLEVLDQFFVQIALQVPQAVQQTVSKFFNLAARPPEQQEKINYDVVEALEARGLSPVVRLKLPVDTTFTNFEAAQIRELPGYIMLHEAARDADIAVNVSYLLKEQSAGGMVPPFVTLDMSKTYVQGADEGGSLYPDLPPPEEKPVAKAPPAKLAAGHHRF